MKSTYNKSSQAQSQVQPPSKSDITKSLKKYLACDDKDVIISFIQEIVINHDKINFPTFIDTNNYDTSTTNQYKLFKKNLGLYKELLYNTDNWKEQNELFSEDSVTIPNEIKAVKIPKARRRRKKVEFQQEKTNFCYIKYCNKSYTTRKALNLHVRKYHSKDSPVKDASEYIQLQRSNPKTYLKNYNDKRINIKNIFKQKDVEKRLDTVSKIAENNPVESIKEQSDTPQSILSGSFKKLAKQNLNSKLIKLNAQKRSEEFVCNSEKIQKDVEQKTNSKSDEITRKSRHLSHMVSYSKCFSQLKKNSKCFKLSSQDYKEKNFSMILGKTLGTNDCLIAEAEPEDYSIFKKMNNNEFLTITDSD